ncbi:uncharacterized protein MELLADRAFT_72415 [Melampsora larici-populina 98AG31]|uniref:Uncharacterized protein n=1 Tax=Melampsora larici-populina (strain 98AG31 / pathotype 3-4-7) TaxID=747676 RepID=F4RTH4_MELLP|nr:uncharacterized protein MELLADRAFT_72415 [Melampsora larici-populina 98AG31]EGG04336.1 hypothetical protein MELLADRAFT_72415 [Melampsora larici-populina 98AG31]
MSNTSDRLSCLTLKGEEEIKPMMELEKPYPTHQTPRHPPRHPLRHSAQSEYTLNVPDSAENSPTQESHTIRPPFLRDHTNRQSACSDITEEFQGPENGSDGECSVVYDDLMGNTSDPLHSIEKVYPRQGRSRYITETGNPFTIWSLRGWLNLGAVTFLFVLLIGLFALLPIYQYATRTATSLDDKTLELSRQSGPFEVSQLPQRLQT